MADLLHRLGYIRKGHLVSVTRDDLVGQYIGHTAPKTKEILKKAMGGVLFIDEAYYLHRPENERDYGQEAIEILLQVMENQRDGRLAGARVAGEAHMQRRRLVGEAHAAARPLNQQERRRLADASFDRGKPDQFAVELGQDVLDAGSFEFLMQVDRRRDGVLRHFRFGKGWRRHGILLWSR
jgi:hypothetical protein